MKTFQTRQLREAIAHAMEGGQALHLHQVLTPSAPRCFKAAVAKGENIAHLLDQDKERLLKTAHKLGVRVKIIDREGTPYQHIDLCGSPLRKAQALKDSKL